MSYSYEAERPYVFTEDGQHDLLATLDFCRAQIASAGSVRMIKVMTGAGMKAGDTSKMHAVVDRLVELNYLHRINQVPTPFGQHEIYVAGSKL